MAQMQCTSYHRDPYETAAWQFYLRECSLRAAREEVAFLEATGGVSAEDLARIRSSVFTNVKVEESGDLISRPVEHETVTVSLKSILTEVVNSDAVNQLCRRVRPVLERHGIVTFKKHQAIHVLRTDAQRIKDLGVGLIGNDY